MDKNTAKRLFSEFANILDKYNIAYETGSYYEYDYEHETDSEIETGFWVHVHDQTFDFDFDFWKGEE